MVTSRNAERRLGKPTKEKMMEWHKKTDAQYESHMTVMPGGDIENEAHFTEDEWSSITTALQDLIDLLEYETDVDYLTKSVYDTASMRSLKDAMKKIRKNAEYMVAPDFLDTYQKITDAM
jgi:hypothetical protein